MIYLIPLWLFIFTGLGFLFYREVQFLRSAKRLAKTVDRAKIRFKRRCLGLAILLVLFALLQLGEFYGGFMDLQQKVLFYLMCMILLIWVMILASRDFHDLAASYSTMRLEMTLSALQDLEKEMASYNKGTDEEAIPALNFQPVNNKDPKKDAPPERSP